jgi:hypothetical protein
VQADAIQEKCNFCFLIAVDPEPAIYTFRTHPHWYPTQMVEASRFSIARPAADIDILLDHLVGERTANHYFRGQTRFYEMAVPSSLRPFSNGLSTDKQWTTVSFPSLADTARLAPRMMLQNGAVFMRY